MVDGLEPVPQFQLPANELKDLECSICFDLVTTAHRCHNKHLFCQTCIASWIQNDTAHHPGDEDEEQRRRRKIRVTVRADADQRNEPGTSMPDPGAVDPAQPLTDQLWIEIKDDLFRMVDYVDDKSSRLSGEAQQVLLRTKMAWHLAKNSTRGTVQHGVTSRALVGAGINADRNIYRKLGRALDRVNVSNEKVQSTVGDVLRVIEGIRALFGRIDVEVGKTVEMDGELDDVASLLADELSTASWKISDAIKTVAVKVDRMRSAAGQTTVSIQSAVELVDVARETVERGTCVDRNLKAEIFEELDEGLMQKVNRLTQLAGVTTVSSSEARDITQELLDFVLENVPEVKPRQLGWIQFTVDGGLCGACPICRQVGQFTASPATDLAVSVLPVSCPFVHATAGNCNWTGCYPDFRDHSHQLERPELSSTSSASLTDQLLSFPRSFWSRLTASCGSGGGVSAQKRQNEDDGGQSGTATKRSKNDDEQR